MYANIFNFQKFEKIFYYLGPMNKFQLSLAVLFLANSFCLSISHAQEASPQDYKIFDAHEKKEISLTELTSRLSDAQVIFFGEEHNDSVAHVLQFETLKNLHKTYGEVALSLEMFTSKDQLVLDEYLLGHITERNLSRDATLWNNYRDYRPLVEYAKEEGLRVIAANAPSRYTNLVTREGLEALEHLSPEAKNLLAPLPVDTLQGRYYDKFAALLGGHANMVNSYIYQSQNLWDATMAHFIHKNLVERPAFKVLHLNGRFHTDEHLGTVAQLRNMNPSVRIAVISSFSDESFPDIDWEKHSDLGDFIIVTNAELPRSY